MNTVGREFSVRNYFGIKVSDPVKILADPDPRDQNVQDRGFVPEQRHFVLNVRVLF